MKMLTSVIEEIIEEFITDHTKYIEANNYLTAEIKNTRTALKEALEKVELLQAVRSDLEQKLRNGKRYNAVVLQKLLTFLLRKECFGRSTSN